MYSLNLRIKTLSPVIITGNRDIGITETFDYISGSSVLGVFASQFIEKKGLANAHEDEIFYNWFLAGNLVFSNVYPVINDGSKELELLPTPLAVQKDKNEQSIMNLALQETQDKTKPIGGYARLNGNQITCYSPTKHLYFHHYREDRLKRHNVASGIFNYDSLDEGQTFAGTICGKKSDLEDFKKLFGNNLSAKIGRSRNTQYGEIEIELLGIKELNPGFEIDDNEIILTFTSPVIMVNEFGFPDVSLKTLSQYLQDALGDIYFEIERYFAWSEDIENYLSVWGIKKPLARAVSAGATYKIVFDDLMNETIMDKLINLVKQGLGERKSEGFGRLVINYAIGDNFIEKDVINKTVEKPADDLPETVKQIFACIARDNIIKVIELEAVSDVNSILAKYFSKLTTSTVGRLELMLKSSESFDSFVNQLSDLRKTAKDKLKNCRMQKETLLQVILDKSKPDLEKVFRNLDKSIQKIAAEACFDYMDDDAFREHLCKIYWLTFLRLMRKKLKTGAK